MLIKHAPERKRDASLPIVERVILALGRFGEAPPGIERHDLIGDVRFPQEAFHLEAEWTGIGDAPGLAELVQSDRHHGEARSGRLERTPGEILRPATVPLFLRDCAASPISNITTAGRLSATTLATWASLSIFCISNFVYSVIGCPIKHGDLPSAGAHIISQNVAGAIVAADLEVAVIRHHPSIEHSATSTVRPPNENRRGVSTSSFRCGNPRVSISRVDRGALSL